MSRKILSEDSLSAIGCLLRIPFNRDEKDYSGNAVVTTVPSAFTYDKMLNGFSTAYCDGSSGYVTTPASMYNFDGASFTLFAWVKMVNYSGFRAIITTARSSGYMTNNTLHFGTRDTGYFTVAFYSNDLDSPDTMPLNEWVCVCATYDATTNYRALYKNGELWTSDTASADLSGTSAYGLAIAIKLWDSVKLYGNLKDVMVFDNPVPAATVKALYRATYIQ